MTDGSDPATRPSTVPERIVVVEDDRELRAFIDEILKDAGYSVDSFGTADRALAALLDELEADLVITDLVMPGMRGKEFVSRLLRHRPFMDVIVITAFGSLELAVELIRAGARDYVPKPFAPDQLLTRVRRLLSETRVHRALSRNSPPGDAALPGIVAASGSMRDLVRIVRRAADSSNPVLITGESGTGKELVARAVHTLSGRRRFVPVNCGALPDHLLESELFGHEKGAFTGADREKEGLFEAADGGTLFLDEVGELPTPLQPKLLRALEEGEIRRVGANRARSVDTRIVAATNRNLEDDVREGRFREDLYWRLDVVRVEVPPLRRRPGDIPFLVEHFLDEATHGSGRRPSEISREALMALARYPWPGNVRELRNAIERAVVLTESDEIQVGDLPARVRDADVLAQRVDRPTDGRPTLAELEQSFILDTLASVDGNKSRAAELLGIDRKTLYRKLEAYGESS